MRTPQPQRCPFCTTTWVDRACIMTGVQLTDLERRRLIAALLSRPHLVLSGPAGSGKHELAHALALSITDGRQNRICLLQGHPWWAARTNNVGFFVNLQTQLSAWQLAHFTQAVVNGKPLVSRFQAQSDAGAHVVCVERMSPVEIELYFRVVSEWLLRNTQGRARPVSIRLIGTYDNLAPPELEERILRVAASVHLKRMQHRDVQSSLSGIRNNGNRR